MKKLIYGGLVLFLLTPSILRSVDAKRLVNSKLIKAVSKIESNHNPKAASRGCLGLMQIKYSVWGKELKEQGIIKKRNDLFDPHINVKAGTYILTKYVHQTGSVRKALVRYSGGSSHYAKKVLAVYAEEN